MQRVVVLASLFLGIACGAAFTPTDELEPAGGPSSRTDSGGAPNAEGGGRPSPRAPLAPCDAETPPPSNAWFVSADGNDTTGQGTAIAPFATLTRALVAAADTARPIMVSTGTFAEPLVVDQRHAGIVLEGGWLPAATGWRRDCSEGHTQRTVLGASAVGLRASFTAAANPVELRRVVLTTAAAAAPSESMYAAFVEGSGTDLRLVDVTLRPAAGGAGAPAQGGGGAGTLGCNGGSDCGAGIAGATPAPAAAASSPGGFGPGGFTPAHGVAGAQGGAGQNGVPGGQGERNTRCHDRCERTPSCRPVYQTREADDGRCGCGGGGGGGGAAGNGGGASVGLFVYGAGNVVHLERVLFDVPGGGAGSAGGTGGPGGPGSAGQRGANRSGCRTACRESDCVAISEQTLQGGGPGGVGGAGGAGGAGGGGAGGDTLGVGTGGGATVKERDEVLFALGPAGAGAGGAPAGRQQERFEF